ncbi:hypothetical protein CERSUDRAFT_119735 [Gelatoporia subvermispora B]|uniref:Uncharacterized protein n=1 Tax=Ceriporiopsis subvermispora (strain B) TaxID=914234 RepID=M2QYB8_CERS8|nr:hypothetical protein CERSUDRAFT_119735 [Gelatoporia subvermispora B]
MPESFVKLALPTDDLQIHDPCAVKAGALCSQTITARQIEAGIQATQNIQCGFAIDCSGEQGAMLITTDDAERREVQPNLCMPSYMRRNYQHWLHLARDVRGHDLKLDEIYFVRGTVKTSTWAVTAFHGNAESYSGNINIYYGPAGFSLSAASSTQNIRTPEMRSGPRRIGPNCVREAIRGDSDHEAPTSSRTGPARNQCIFLHYYKLKARPLVSPKIIMAAAEPRDPSDDSRDEDQTFLFRTESGKSSDL